MARNRTRRNRNKNNGAVAGGKLRKTHRGKTHKRRHSRKARN